MQLWLIPFLPLAGAAINGFTGRRTSKTVQSAVAIGSVLLSFLWVVKTLMALMPLEERYVEHYFTWMASGMLQVGVDFAVDRLTAVMLCGVTGIGTLIHIYATGYMHEEEGYYRFFAYLNLFMFFMLILVLGGNFLILFVGWEGVGLCSYLLIGFYFLKKSATDAGKKAFIVNRIGDFGFSLAMFLIVVVFGSLDFGTVFEKAKGMPVEASAGMITAICLLLFLGAGSVIHACHHEQDMRHMGGLRKKIPHTFNVLLIAALAIAGFPLMSGWWSKEEILGAAMHHHPWMYWVAWVTALMTAFYVFRSIFLTFFGEYKGHAHPHESPWVMIGPLYVLAALSVVGGWLFKIPHILEPVFHGIVPEGHSEHSMMDMVMGTAPGFIGIALAYIVYVANPSMADSLKSSFSGLYNLLYNKYFVDEAYDATIVHPIERSSRNFLWKVVDAGVIDNGFVHGFSGAAQNFGDLVRRVQNGEVRNYGAWVVIGVIFVLGAVTVLGGGR